MGSPLMATAQVLHDQAVIHRLGLNRFSNALVRSVLALLNDTDADVVGRISRGDFGDRKHNQSELETLLTEIRVMQAQGWLALGETLTGHLDDLAAVELEFNERLVATGAAQVGIELQTMRLTVSQVVAAAKARPFQTRLLKEWLSDSEEAARRRVTGAIRMGFVEGQSIPEIVRRIRGTRAQRFTDGILEINRRGAEAMVRTAVTHIASVAANEVYSAFEDVVEGIRWVSTLDSRTSLTCASLDGKIFSLDKGPRPPGHVNCRSTTIPVLVGMEPFERTTFEAWVSGQPSEVQDDVLGATRARLFRSGGLKLDRMTDNRGEVLTLDELRQRDASSFRAAGLE